ncbi:MAG: hypothetical protein M4D85_07145, partial [Actinomycetota bacterium]|nr:hypothetical protein [Actinomycetota bacterium]
ISAVVVVLLAVGVFKALDTASATSGAIKGRAIAAGLAQADLERLRGMKVSDLSNRRETNYRVQGGITFTVASRADWVTDQSAPASCSSDNSRADYLKITSSVTWPAMGGIDPVVLTSVQAAPVGSFASDEGSLAVAVVDAAGEPVVGKQVTISGLQGYTDVTNELGCVLWGYLDQGNYTVTLSPGCSDRAGNSPVTKPVSVVGEAVTTVELDCDVPGDIRAKFDTDMVVVSSTGTQSRVVKASTARYLSAGNSGLPAPFWRAFGDGSDQTEIVATTLYPFTEQYALYSGNCANSDPRTAPNAGSATLQAAPRGGTAGPVTVREPAINVQILDASVSGNPPLAGARVKVYTRTTGCSGTYDLTAVTKTNAQGQVADPGVPYGVYDICADYNGKGSASLLAQKADTAIGTTFQQIKVATDGSGTTCAP